MSDKDENENSKNHDTDDNVIEFKKPEKSSYSEKTDPQLKPSPIINLPPLTKVILLGIIGIHIVVTLLLSADLMQKIYLDWGFIPARFSGSLDFSMTSIFTPITHMLLHGSWIHIAMNGIMLAAFGSGVENWLGPKRTFAILVFSGLCGVALHYAFHINSVYPVIGASGGISGLFAAALIMIQRQHGPMTQYGIWPFVILWIVISVAFGFIGSPDGSAVAWAAHLGGFFGGFVALKLMKIL
ncbi:MAG: rhomboid family intramembrane serine protease [Pseudomonadota bacterium]